MTLPYLVSAIAMPFVGYLSDRSGKRPLMMCILGFLNFLGHLIEILHPPCNKCWTSIIPQVIYGFCITFYICILFGIVPYLVEAKKIGTAYGIVTCFQNIGTTVLPLLVSVVSDHTGHSNTYVQLCFLGVAALSMATKFALIRWDQVARNGLLQALDPSQLF